MEQETQDLLTGENELRITNEISRYVIETSKWAKFIAITFYFIVGIFVVLFAIYGREILDFYFAGMEDAYTFFLIFLLVIAGVIVVTYYFLFNFANKMQAGIGSENIELVNSGLRSLHIHFVLIGILAILMLLFALYGMLN